MADIYKKSEAFLQKDELNFLFTKVNEIKRLHESVMPYIDKNMRDGVKVANMIGKRLILLADSGAIATYLRFNKSTLLIQFMQHPILKRFNDIHCIVRVAETLPRQVTKQTENKMPLLDAETGQIIKDIAATIDDPKLKAVMERIASHTRRVD